MPEDVQSVAVNFAAEYYRLLVTAPESIATFVNPTGQVTRHDKSYRGADIRGYFLGEQKTANTFTVKISDVEVRNNSTIAKPQFTLTGTFVPTKGGSLQEFRQTFELERQPSNAASHSSYSIMMDSLKVTVTSPLANLYAPLPSKGTPSNNKSAATAQEAASAQPPSKPVQGRPAGHKPTVSQSWADEDDSTDSDDAVAAPPPRPVVGDTWSAATPPVNPNTASEVPPPLPETKHGLTEVVVGRPGSQLKQPAAVSKAVPRAQPQPAAAPKTNSAAAKAAAPAAEKVAAPSTPTVADGATPAAESPKKEKGEARRGPSGKGPESPTKQASRKQAPASKSSEASATAKQTKKSESEVKPATAAPVAAPEAAKPTEPAKPMSYADRLRGFAAPAPAPTTAKATPAAEAAPAKTETAPKDAPAPVEAEKEVAAPAATAKPKETSEPTAEATKPAAAAASTKKDAAPKPAVESVEKKPVATNEAAPAPTAEPASEKPKVSAWSRGPPAPSAVAIVTAAAAPSSVVTEATKKPAAPAQAQPAATPEAKSTPVAAPAPPASATTPVAAAAAAPQAAATKPAGARPAAGSRPVEKGGLANAVNHYHVFLRGLPQHTTPSEVYDALSAHCPMDRDKIKVDWKAYAEKGAEETAEKGPERVRTFGFACFATDDEQEVKANLEKLKREKPMIGRFVVHCDEVHEKAVFAQNGSNVKESRRGPTGPATGKKGPRRQE